MITDSSNCCGRTGRSSKGPSKASQQQWHLLCDQYKVRRRCQSEGLNQEGDPLKELNWCCDRGCVLNNRSQKCSQIKKTDLDMNDKKINHTDDTNTEGGNSFYGHNKKHHSKLHNDEVEIELGNQINKYNHDNELELGKQQKTQKCYDSSEKCRPHQENSEGFNYHPMGDFFYNKPYSDGGRKIIASEIRERYISEMEILRSKLNLLRNEIGGDGKRLRQRSESEPGFAELSGGVPKRARDISPKVKADCRRLPGHQGLNQSPLACPEKQNLPFQRESKSLSPATVKSSDKVSASKHSRDKLLNLRNSNEDQESNEDTDDSEEVSDDAVNEDGCRYNGRSMCKQCGGIRKSNRGSHAMGPWFEFASGDGFSDGSVQSNFTSASSDSNTPSKVGESLGSISLNETPKDSDLNFDAVPGFEQISYDGEVMSGTGLFRSSLFPNVPPYVKFFMHDFKGPPLPADITRHLKWKLSSITPIVIRKTLINSGFKLVRRSFEKYYKHIYISPHRKEGEKSLCPQSSRSTKKSTKESNEWTGQWGKHMKSFVFKTLKDFQKLNHFPGTFQIGRKDRLWKNLYRLMVKFGKKEFGFIPKTYILPHDRKLLRTAWEKFSGSGKGQWIVKPPAAARGTGIKVIHKWGQIPKKKSLIVQKYIAQPYLINGSKFDLRLYVLMTSIHPLRIYLYDDGLVRFASVKYSDNVECLSNRFMHLTNYSINKLSTQYQVNADATSCNGHKWSLKSLWTYLTKEGVNVKALKRNLKDLVIKTIISGESNINILSKNNLPSRYCSYELFGIDVLLDHSLKPWLLEVNISPSLHSASPLDLAVKGPLVKELLNIAGFQIPAKFTKEQEEGLLESHGLSRRTHTMCYDKRLYWTALSKEEKAKQEFFHNVPRKEYLGKILDDLTPDDVRHLIQFEDELTQTQRFEKIFPTTQTHTYHQFFDSPRYYNMMLDAWETKYQNDRANGIRLLAAMCEKKIHLHVPNQGGKTKSSLNPSDPTCQTLPETDSEVEKEEPEQEEEKSGTAESSTSSTTKPKSPSKPAVVSKPTALSYSLSRRSKPSTPKSPPGDGPEPHVPFKETCMKMLAEIRQSGLKFPADSKPEKLKQLPNCKLENSMSEGLTTGKSVLSSGKHMHNACIKMNTSS